jgi:hypothetical protein
MLNSVVMSFRFGEDKGKCNIKLTGQSSMST